MNIYKDIYYTLGKALYFDNKGVPHYILPKFKNEEEKNNFIDDLVIYHCEVCNKNIIINIGERCDNSILNLVLNNHNKEGNCDASYMIVLKPNNEEIGEFLYKAKRYKEYMNKVRKMISKEKITEILEDIELKQIRN